MYATSETNPKNRHCIRGLDGKYSRRDEILKDILNGKLKIVPNKKRAESDTEEDDDDEDEEMPEEAGTPIVQYLTHPRKTGDTCQYGQIRKKTRCNYTHKSQRIFSQTNPHPRPLQSKLKKMRKE